MAWSSLGTIDLDNDWRIFDVPLIGDSLIKVSQAFDQSKLSRFVNKIVFAEYYAFAGRHPLFSVYRKTDDRIYDLHVSTVLREQGMTVRYLEAKHNGYGIIDPASWRVECSLWIPDGGRGQILTGGSYDGTSI